MDSWIKKDLRYNWHPYTQMKDALKRPPILIEKARGPRLYDAKGNFYYDTISSWWCNVHGHNHPRIKMALKKQVDELEHVLFAGFTHRQAITLAERLIKLAPQSLTKVFFSDNGSTSVEAALKMSIQYWSNIGEPQKHKFVSLDLGYHGDTAGAMGVSGVDLFNRKFASLFFPSFKAASPYCYRCPLGLRRSSCGIDCACYLEKILKANSAGIAAIIIEPLVLAASGIIVYPKEYLSRAAALAKKYGVHLILDEVATGFGRTGKMFACEYTPEVMPDFMCLSKGITAGYLPFGATLTTDEIYGAFLDRHDKSKTFYHGHTYTANPLCCSVANASLDIFKEDRVLERVSKLIPIFHNRLEEFRQLKLVGDVRYIGLIGALELVRDKKNKKRFGPSIPKGEEIYQKALKKNLILRPLGDIIYLFLPLCLNRAELEDILDRTYSVVTAAN